MRTKLEVMRRHPAFQVAMGVRALIEADRLAREIAQALDRRAPGDHHRRRDEIDRRAERHLAGEAVIDDFRAVEKGKIVGAVLDALERLVGIVRLELDLALGAEQRRADRAAKVEVEAGGFPPVRRLADEARARDAAAADDAAGLDALDERAGMGGRRQGERDVAMQRKRLMGARSRLAAAAPPRASSRPGFAPMGGGRGAAAAQLYAGSVDGSELNPSGITFGMPCRTSSGVTPIASQPLPP